MKALTMIGATATRGERMRPMSDYPISLGTRLRRGLFGYRRSDVIQTLERMHWQLDTMAASLDRMWSERDALRTELRATRTWYEHELAAERARSQRIEAEARAIRGDAQRQLAEASARLAEVVRLRDEILAALAAPTRAPRRARRKAASAANGDGGGAPLLGDALAKAAVTRKRKDAAGDGRAVAISTSSRRRSKAKVER